jgi:HSP20 family protein
MLMRTDPFRELDRFTQQVFGTAARPAAMPMDAYRHGDSFYVHLDLPGIDADSISLTVEQNVLTVRADRAPVKADGAELLIAERPYGTYTRQVFLGETLDADKIAADYAAGVLTLTIPVRESAKPRSIQVTSSDTKQVAFRAAMDYRAAVERLVVMDGLPVTEHLERLNEALREQRGAARSEH